MTSISIGTEGTCFVILTVFQKRYIMKIGLKCTLCALFRAYSPPIWLMGLGITAPPFSSDQK